jgi:hypothetical protein
MTRDKRRNGAGHIYISRRFAADVHTVLADTAPDGSSITGSGDDV